MNHQDHVDLLRVAVLEHPGRWADFGSGKGAFTLALRDLLGPEAEILSIEKDRARLNEQHRNFRTQFPKSNVLFMDADFSEPLDLGTLDGLVIANALHFFRDKEPVIRQLRRYLKPNGRFVVVEYDVDEGNQWVPFPISFNSLRTLAPKTGLTEPKLLCTKPSRFLREIYSACADKIVP
jgi:ubiquinone/menaquinone biosynthesis C-methylase UbiE